MMEKIKRIEKSIESRESRESEKRRRNIIIKGMEIRKEEKESG